MAVKEEGLKLEKQTLKILIVPGMTECPSCVFINYLTRVCKNCGSYNGEEVVSK